MTARLTSAMLVAALIRRVNSVGGIGTVLHRGEANAGSILLVASERGVVQALYERVIRAEGDYQWTAIGPDTDHAINNYIARRRSNDPDIWVIELDVAQAERFAAEATATG